MPCQSCDHTMQRVNDGHPPTFWCPRCGTLKMEGGVPEFEEPKLVNRAFRLCEQALDALATLKLEGRWHEGLAHEERCVREAVEGGSEVDSGDLPDPP